ncbi:TonB-dependent receptor [Leptospira ilyithenensis]|uniref:TonB-dependent receptor n=1 Tax=Leptospira ilyithenensis TaxID=2484901 RepID=A0A4R9LWR0_9LEPT|nr:TonB-dependent receptor [Leptospira ilyithenensis]TGN14582.1 TonB-dependent receptor [Leptospira ilyithenensis]
MKKTKFILILFFVFFYFQEIYGEKQLDIKFQLVRSSSGRPIANATVVAKYAKASGITDGEGTAVLSFPSPGFYEIRIVAGDRIETSTKEIRYSGQVILISIREQESGGIIVSGERDKTPLSRYGLQQDEIKRIPGVAGDSLKALQTIPGVVIGVPVGVLPTAFTNVGANAVSGVPYSNSERGDLSLRGGGTRQNQYFFDGFPLSYPFHLGNQSSVLNNNLIRSFDVYTGAFPSRYGFATGGIISVEGTDRVEQNKTIVNMNFFLTDAYNQTKISPSISMITSGRKNYPNFVLLKTYPDAIPQDAKFAEYHDFQWKMIWDISNEQRLSVQTFGGRDRQAYTKQQASYERDGADPRPPTGLDRLFRTDGIRHIWKGKSFRNTLSYSRTEFREFFELRITNPATAENIFGLQNRTSDYLTFAEERLELDVLEDYIKFEGGVQFRSKETNLKGENITSTNRLFSQIFDNLINSSPQFRSIIDGDRIRYHEAAGFAEFQGKWHGFRLNPGGRVDTYSGSGEVNLSPRITGGYVFESTKTSILAGHGIHYNSPVSVEQLSKRAGNPNLFMERSEHNSLGVAQELPKGWSLKLEVFHNIFQNIIVADSYAIDPYSLNNDLRLFVRDPSNAINSPLTPRNLNYSNSGYGFSEGIEFFVKKTKDPREESGAFGWISYTNSLTKRNNNQARLSSDEQRDRSLENSQRTILAQTKIGTNYLNYYDNNTTEFIFNNDRMELYDLHRSHILNIVFGYKFSPEWQIGGRYRYFSGSPFTPITGANRLNQAATFGANLYIPEYSKAYNSDVYAPFHQFDLRFDKFDNYSWGYINVYLEFVNFYGRRNQSGQNFDNLRAYERGVNPAPVYDTVNSPYVQSEDPRGRIVYLPIVNLGMEVRF